MRTQPTQEDIISAVRRHFAAEDAYVGASGLLNDSAARTRERRDAALADRDAAYGALRGLAGGGR